MSEAVELKTVAEKALRRVISEGKEAQTKVERIKKQNRARQARFRGKRK